MADKDITITDMSDGEVQNAKDVIGGRSSDGDEE